MIQTIVYFTDSDGFGGVELAMLHLLARLDRQRWQPVLFHHAEPGLVPLLEQAQHLGVKLREVRRMPLGRQGALLVSQFVKELRAERPAVFHAHLTWPLACKYALVGAVMARIPAVVATEHLFIDLPYNRSTRIQQRLLAAGVHCYIAVSHQLARHLQQAFQIPGRKIKVVHPAIPVDRFNQSVNTTLRVSLTRPTKQSLILTTARLDNQKGLCYLLEAARLVPEAVFVVAGDGPERTALEAKARELRLGDRIVFLGFRQDIPDLLASCDVFVLPSLFEGLPASVLEAMAAGKPVIATAIGGTDEAIVHGETGLLVPPADPTALAEAIQLVLSDPVRAQRMAAAGQARVQQEFSVETMVQRVTTIYDELLNSDEAAYVRQ
jgi:glycosyltransferase involved in cell wall biosynthesis